MASKPLRFDPRAEDEYFRALEWYRERSVTAATNLQMAIAQAIERIKNGPQRWPICAAEIRKYTTAISL